MKNTLLLMLTLMTFVMYGQATFSISLSSDTISPGDLLAITFKVENASTSDFKAPSLMGMKVLAGPNQSSMMRMTNGKVEQSVTYTYYVTVEDEGEFLIGAASIKAEGKTLETLPTPFMAIEGFDTPAVDEGEDMFGGDGFERFYRQHGFDLAPSQEIPTDTGKKKKRKTIRI